MDGTNHIDSADERDLVHMLMLADEDVKDDEGGEFINATQDETVPYKFGRLIEFNANDEHRGMPINKPYVCRMSIRYVGTDNERKLND
jgi:Rps23 Pro-64 3,4-dihydroxylase Tpa1-like proline 4-hydroxylase